MSASRLYSSKNVLAYMADVADIATPVWHQLDKLFGIIVIEIFYRLSNAIIPLFRCLIESQMGFVSHTITVPSMIALLKANGISFQQVLRNRFHISIRPTQKKRLLCHNLILQVLFYFITLVILFCNFFNF